MAEVGRPTVMTPEVVAKLEVAFANGATDVQACFIANISKDALYDYQNLHPDFTERKEALKDMAKYQAKSVVIGRINAGDPEMSKWYLERRDKDYKPKSDLTSNDKEITMATLLFELNGDNQGTIEEQGVADSKPL